MDRRKFLIGFSGTAIAGGALVGSGAFSRVESQRDVTVQVAEDPDAYLGLSGTGSPNSDNYVSIDNNGHLAIDISEHDDFSGPDADPGEGVNSDSFTYFDGMVEVCNQGKEDVGFYIEPPTDDDFPSGVDATGPDGTPYEDEPRLQFYTGEAALDGEAGTDSVMGEANAETVLLGECIELGVRVMTKGIDASDDTGIDTLFDEEVRLIADVTKLSTPDRAVYNVDQDEFFQTIQPALDDADPGDTVQVLEGTEFAPSGGLTIDTSELTLVATSNTKPILAGGVDVRAGEVTVDGFEIRNPGTQGAGNPGSPAGLVGVDIASGNENVSVLNNVITDIGTGDNDANPIGVLASDGTSGVTVDNNEISNLEGTDEDEAQVQGVLINESGTQITDATVTNNTITDLLDTRSTNAVRFNGDVTGEIIGNTISDLNTEGDIPGTNDPGGFTQVIALQEGGGSNTGPSNVTVQGNDVSNIETTTPGNFAPPVHLSLGSSAGPNVTVGGTSSSEENNFSADSPDVEIFVQDNSGTLTLSDVESENSFAPSSQIGPGGSRIFPGDLRLVTDSDDLQTQIDNANPGDTLAVDSGTFDAVTVDKSLSLKSIFARPTVEADSGTGRLEVSAPNVEISGFDIDLSDGEVVYVNPGEGLTFRNNVVDVSSSSDHGIRIDDSFGGPTVVEANVFDVPSTDASVNSQGILFSGGEDYLIKNNVINGPGKNADSPDDANAGILASVQADTTDADIQDNEISAFDQAVLLFENPPSANLDRFSITGNSISDTDTGVLAVELAGDGDTFGEINGESATNDQQQALESDNTFASSVDTEADVQADP